MISDWILMPLVMLGIVVAAFLTWRDQKRLTEAAESNLRKAIATHAEEKRAWEEKNKPILAIELEDEKNGWSGDASGHQTWICRVIVRNTSPDSTADDVGLSLVEIDPEPLNPPRPLPYDLGKSGTNCAEKRVQLHAGMTAKFDLFRFSPDAATKFRAFQIQDVPQSNLGMVPMASFQSQELRLVTVTQIFKLVAGARSVPRLFKV